MTGVKWIVLLFLILGGTLAQAKDIPNLALEVKTRLEVSPELAFVWLQSLGSTKEVCEIYDQAVRDLYWLEKGAKSLVLVGQSGINFCLSQAQKIEDTDEALAKDLKSQAKTIAYNVAANSWPGWGDDGVTISTQDIEAGLAAAKLNLSLAFVLSKPNDKISAAYWLLSAQQLASSAFQDAVASILQSDVYAKKSSDNIQLAFNEGYRGLILLASGDKAVGQSAFDSGIGRLTALATEDAKGYIGQLETAKRFFVK